jgi:predicted AAA+ superfamily ATPase
MEPAIGRDILAMSQVRRPALLRQVFAAAVSAPATIISLQKLQGQLQDRGALETLAHYLSLLEDAYLIASLQKYSTRANRRRSSPPKLIVLDNGLVTSSGQGGDSPERLGGLVENACLAYAWNSGQDVTYWREEPHEVDAVVEGDWGKWAIEVKTGSFRSKDLEGLLHFVGRHRSFRPLVITGDGGAGAAGDIGIPAIPWKRFLVDGPPRD